MDVIVAKNIDQLKNITTADNDRIIMIVDDLFTQNVYAVHDRIGFDVIIIAPHSYSNKTDISKYLNFMKDHNIKSMYLVRNSDIVDNQIHKIINSLKPVSVRYLS